MRIHATISEGTLASTLIEYTARNVTQGLSILITEVFLCGACRVEVRWDDQVTGLTADRTGTEMMFSSALIVGGTPRPDAFQAEYVLALV